MARGEAATTDIRGLAMLVGVAGATSVGESEFDDEDDDDGGTGTAAGAGG